MTIVCLDPTDHFIINININHNPHHSIVVVIVVVSYHNAISTIYLAIIIITDIPVRCDSPESSSVKVFY